MMYSDISCNVITKYTFIKRGYQLMILMLFVLPLCYTIFFRIAEVYRDAPLEQLNTKIECGPAKGLITTEEHALQYSQLYDIIQKYKNVKGRVFFTKLCPWAYLCLNNRYGTHSSWRVALDDDLLLQYYYEKPENKPNIVFVLNDSVGNYISSKWCGCGSSLEPNTNRRKGILWNELSSLEYNHV